MSFQRAASSAVWILGRYRTMLRPSPRSPEWLLTYSAISTVDADKASPPASRMWRSARGSPRGRKMRGGEGRWGRRGPIVGGGERGGVGKRGESGGSRMV